ncbi:MAG: hypothetical protein ACJ8FY_00110 [Gemmataceae bacterium]
MRPVCFGSLVVCLPMVSLSTLRADNQAESKPLLEKAIKEMGGDAKLAKLKSGSWKAKITGQEDGKEIVLTSEGLWQGRDQYKMDVEMQINGMTKKALLVINRENGWAQEGGNTKDAPKEILVFIKNVVYAMRVPQMLPSFSDKEFTLSPLGEVKVGDVEAAGLRIAHKDFKEVSLFFDKKSGLPNKAEITLTDPGSREITIECFFSEYKEFAKSRQTNRLPAWFFWTA